MRGKDLTYQLLAFARGGGPMRKATDLVALVRQSAIHHRDGTKNQASPSRFPMTYFLSPWMKSRSARS